MLLSNFNVYTTLWSAHNRRDWRFAWRMQHRGSNRNRIAECCNNGARIGERGWLTASRVWEKSEVTCLAVSSSKTRISLTHIMVIGGRWLTHSLSGRERALCSIVQWRCIGWHVRVCCCVCTRDGKISPSYNNWYVSCYCSCFWWHRRVEYGSLW